MQRKARRNHRRALFFSVRDLTKPSWIITKGFLFSFLGLLSGALLLIEHPTVKTAVLLAISVWSFCRFYYFAFYVLERYVDPSFKFSGLVAMVQYLFSRSKREIESCQEKI